MPAPLLRLTDVSKSYTGNVALASMSLEIRSGEVLCILGDNGAGKSTLIKIISGVHRPSTGIIEVDGERVTFDSPKTAARYGIAAVQQFGGTFPLMNIARSFFVGEEPTKGFGPLRWFDRKTAGEVAVREVRKLGITRVTDGNQLVGSLSGGERQSLAIARAVYFGAKVLILDEPTAALGVKESSHVLRMIMQARAEGVAVVFVTHNVMHAMTVGDRFAVLIHGSKADDFLKGERSREEITDLMAGGEAMAELEAELAVYTDRIQLPPTA